MWALCPGNRSLLTETTFVRVNERRKNVEKLLRGRRLMFANVS